MPTAQLRASSSSVAALRAALGTLFLLCRECLGVGSYAGLG
jgi:hypothetical protein